MTSLLWKVPLVAALGLALPAAPRAMAQGVRVDAPGVEVRVGPDQPGGADGVRVDAPGVRVEADAAPAAPPAADVVAPPPSPPAPPAKPTYWIGILGGDVGPDLKAQLGREDLSVLVREVVEGSPAEQAGVRAFDILLAAGDQPITSMSDLVDLVRAAGEAHAAVELTLLRAGKEVTVSITPAERPAAPVVAGPPVGAPQPEGLLDRIFGAPAGAPGEPFNLRVFGPGVLLNGPNVQVQAQGTSVAVQSVNGQTRVKVSRGGETWDVDANNPEEVAALPPDVRTIVENVTAEGVNVDVNVDDILRGVFGPPGPVLDGRGMHDRMERMERELLELRRQLGAAAPPVEADVDADPQPTPQPVEIEVPAEE